ncbi:hypothetical protein CDN99_03350 [Roseateles aquatilis]|uniref:Uncharacterized protein n=1 Tax=Roseateles aquatilis TaxID=431061 RepID=A0A246JLJ9_9BURK|nr:hypothetical protein [Roseateles aquatilis]OWQ93516.1 hypothetical protein CDN99_03350 [Roseateles aquatilis]
MRPHAPVPEIPRRLTPHPGVVLLIALATAGCAQQPPKTVVREVRVEVPVQVPVVSPSDNAARALLQANDRLRQLSPLELAQEVAPRDDGALTPGAATQLALALMISHNNGETFRAQTLLDQVLRTNSPEANDWRALAQFLVDRVAEQRRLEDQLEKSNAAGRDLQRRLDQANQKLEALKAIERSLGGPRSAVDKP